MQTSRWLLHVFEQTREYKKGYPGRNARLAMHLAFVTTHDPHDAAHWAGTTVRMARALEAQGITLSYIGPLVERRRVWNKLKQVATAKALGKSYHRDREPLVLEEYARQVEQRIRALPQRPDGIFTNGTIPIARLQTDLPIIFWTDATYRSFVNTYIWDLPPTARSQRLGDEQERAGIAKASLAIYSSDWAARSAIEDYGANPAKVKVVPLGANIDESRTAGDICRFIERRPTDRCKLLFVGTGWQRKGGDVAIEVARRCNDMGLPTELTLLGSDAPTTDLPPFVTRVGFIDKRSPEGRGRFDNLFADAHFFLFPARAEAFGVVLCEANSYGVPNITTNVGGIPTIVRDGVNGVLFSPEDPTAMATRIVELMQNRERYAALARSSFEEYQQRLNWRVAGRRVKELIDEIVRR